MQIEFAAGSPVIASSAWLVQNKNEAEVTKPMNAPSGDATTQAPGGPAGPAGPQPDAGGGGLMQLLPMLLIMFGVLYFVIIRPERKRQKEAASLRSSLKKGDKILLASGMVGTLAGMADDWVTVEIADKVRVTFQKSSVVQVLEAKDKEKSDAAAAAK
jgi:preprotein translocase subunit YajC